MSDGLRSAKMRLDRACELLDMYLDGGASAEVVAAIYAHVRLARSAVGTELATTANASGAELALDELDEQLDGVRKTREKLRASVADLARLQASRRAAE